MERVTLSGMTASAEFGLKKESPGDGAFFPLVIPKGTMPTRNGISAVLFGIPQVYSKAGTAGGNMMAAGPASAGFGAGGGCGSRASGGNTTNYAAGGAGVSGVCIILE